MKKMDGRPRSTGHPLVAGGHAGLDGKMCPTCRPDDAIEFRAKGTFRPTPRYYRTVVLSDVCNLGVSEWMARPAVPHSPKLSSG